MVMLPAKQTPFPENKMSVTPPTWKNDELVVPPLVLYSRQAVFRRSVIICLPLEEEDLLSPRLFIGMFSAVLKSKVEILG